MEEKVWAAIRTYNMVQMGDNVIVALSGGADSMALFHFFCAHRQKLGITLAAAHFNHGLRGAASNADAAFVREVCEREGVALYTENGDMNTRTKPGGVGTEEWARTLRYTFFETLSAQHRAKIATAHTLSDNAETVLFNAARGTGVRGLCGIPPVRGAYIRPLVEVARGEVEAYCAAHRILYVTDHTNADVAYARNRLRHNILPELEQVHPGAQRALGRLAANMREVDEWLCTEAQALLAASRSGEGYSADVLLGAAGPVRKYALSSLVGIGVTQRQLEEMERVLRGELVAVQLGGGRTARLQGNTLHILFPLHPVDVPPYEVPLTPGSHSLPGGYRLRVEVVTREQYRQQTEKYMANHLTFLANCDKIFRSGVIRNRRRGDRFSPAGRNGSKPLKKWMNEQHIPVPQRAALPLIAQNARVLWVWGHGFCDGAGVTGEAERILVVRCEEE